ncbi:uncharacterized protein LOC119087056 isoform X2 [Peromyscus leucopus]|uniref:uncharacterized protein LOC119087056 isoform X2 n=1 Tax=Peromyscus leucopus TaxID=10041 RepID=UPI001884B709|nr:uncharacterized protein LOC119087056 isoform X2 [Peromyscus leucopus]
MEGGSLAAACRRPCKPPDPGGQSRKGAGERRLTGEHGEQMLTETTTSQTASRQPTLPKHVQQPENLNYTFQNAPRPPASAEERPGPETPDYTSQKPPRPRAHVQAGGTLPVMGEDSRSRTSSVQCDNFVECVRATQKTQSPGQPYRLLQQSMLLRWQHSGPKQNQS